jgi:hypothetical protein
VLSRAVDLEPPEELELPGLEPPPPVRLSFPQLAFHTSLTMDASQVACTRSSLGEQLGDGAEARHRKVGRVNRFDVWSTGTGGDAEEDRAREATLDSFALPVASPTAGFALFVDGGTIARDARKGFAEMPHRYNLQFEPDSRGAILLTDLLVSLQSPGIVVTIVKGRYAPDGINTPFTVRISETFVSELAA